ncbi:BlaR1 family beta-lactam sensor/signal transducer [Cellulosilyticum lentocellum]|uniref:Beta-lactamase n=1 Tax=Cellulosilyticum lentocellum (strain ATCC 49066 / DSM 5427 / NCIMB 11756 / RHM5) TaxID=642492 RepID=F2JLR7_CELLD|nr:BlaR1 family beta-lactam sensor/signal transducer [Cellulosilyticum lentocellum]ADZ84593.1 Beta-lactamase [Cellulosilyticum lentocellum DSM 5427]
MYLPFSIHFLVCCFLLSFFIGGILLVKYLFKNQLSTTFQYYLDFILCFTLLVPFIPNTFFYWNIRTLLPFSFSDSTTYSEYGNYSKQTLSIINQRLLQDFSISTDKQLPDLLITSFEVIWLSGILLLVLIAICYHKRFYQKQKYLKPVTDSALISLLATCKQELGITSFIDLRLSSSIKSPILIGLLKPKIILPHSLTQSYSIQEVRYIFLHELQHYKHKDILINYIISALTIIYWFHPLILYALKEMKLDRELVCDSSVLNGLEEDQYADYGYTLIHFADQAHSYPLAPRTNLSQGKDLLKKRIIHITHYQSPSKKLKVKSYFIFGLVVLITLQTLPLIARPISNKVAFNFGSSNVKEEDLHAFFGDYIGTFVLYDLEEDTYSIYNKTHALERTSPNSTYKLYSALFALDANTITPEHSKRIWDGTIYPFETWNQDQTLISAMNYSVNWYFQDLDTALGASKLATYLKKLHYGNEDLSGGMDTFWLNSSLKISPLEQVQLLTAFYKQDLAFNPKDILTLKQAIKISESSTYILSGKTGTGRVNDKDISGWFMGYIEKSGKAYIFATHIASKEYADGARAADIAISILKEKGLYEAS